MDVLEIDNFRVYAGEKEIVKGVSLSVKPGEVHVVMGQNGSGKSTLLCALAGHPKYRASGKASFGGRDLLAMRPHERARAGIFLAFQSPHEVSGVSLSSFLRRAWVARMGREISVAEFERELSGKMSELDMEKSFAQRGVNEGFSGGEKKRSEMLQMAMLEPKLALLDELDSGLDVDALDGVARLIGRAKSHDTAIVIVTHYSRILKNLTPDAVHVMRDGKIIASGKAELAHKLEEKGYEWINKSV